MSSAKTIYRWYWENRRNWPWRETKDPYAIWVSEVMLQQTRLQTVVPKYVAFMERFPTIRDLAEADPGDVPKAWEGLGYYRRAASLQKAAKEVLGRFEGCVPSGQGEFRSLPGVGPYTEAAVLSIAFGKDLAVVDGNVIRVLSRLFRQEATHPRDYQDTAMQFLLDARSHMGEEWDPGDYNQAIMEFGQRICGKQPDCRHCPIQKNCLAYLHGDVDRFPIGKPKTRKHKKVSSVVIRKGNAVLVQQSRMGAMAGFYEFLWEVPDGIHVDHKGTFRHRIQDTQYEVDVWEGYADTIPLGIWVQKGDLRTLTLTGIARKTREILFGD